MNKIVSSVSGFHFQGIVSQLTILLASTDSAQLEMFCSMCYHTDPTWQHFVQQPKKDREKRACDSKSHHLKSPQRLFRQGKVPYACYTKAQKVMSDISHFHFFEKIWCHHVSLLCHQCLTISPQKVKCQLTLCYSLSLNDQLFLIGTSCIVPNLKRSPSRSGLQQDGNSTHTYVGTIETFFLCQGV